jgi:polysaccharide export outer membrane protein
MRPCAISVVFATLLVLLAAQTAAAQNACAVVDERSYPIAPGDTLIFSGVDGCFAQAIVHADGTIVLPLAGEIQVAGLTSSQASEMIDEHLSKYIRNPHVRVLIRNANSHIYYVDGEVYHPGAYCLETPTTVFEALNISGGFRKRANLNKIRILRGSQVFKFNYKEVRKGTHPEQNILVEQGDHIIAR